jgi:hypothetical protein
MFCLTLRELNLFVSHAIQARVNVLSPNTRRINMIWHQNLISVLSRLLVDDSTPFDTVFGTRGRTVPPLYEKV